MPESRALSWAQLDVQRPFEVRAAAGCLRNWAADQRSAQITLELRLHPKTATYLLGWPPAFSDAVIGPLRAIPNITMRKVDDAARRPVIAAAHLRANTPHRPLRTDDPEAVVRALLAVSIRLRKGEELVLQLILGHRRVPLAVPDHSPSSVVAPWYTVAWLGDGGPIDGEKRKALRSKVSDFGFAMTIRLGVTAGTADRRKSLLLGLAAAVRVAEAPGVQLRPHREPPDHLNHATLPWRFRLRLGIGELIGLTGWPVGDGDLPGLAASHPKRLPPAPCTTGKQLVIADSLDGSDALVLPVNAVTRHVLMTAPTGAGKSTLLANYISQVIASGHAAVIIEPKGDLVTSILERVDAADHDRIVVLDPNDSAPVGLNPLATGPGRRPDLVADGLLTVFKQLYGKALGARSQDILYAGLLTLAMHPGASLVMLPLLFTNDGFRRSLTKSIRDPLVLGPFWATFEQWSPAERVAAVSPVMNKLRPLLRPGVRGVLGQREPRFSIEQVFTERKVLLVPLQRGIIGPEAASLLGSLVVAELWQAIQGRAAITPAKRHPVAVVIDEVQDYLSLPTDLSEALAQARGYGVGFVLAHQFLSQLPRDMRSAVMANALNRIVFRLPHEDAIQFEKGHPELAAADFESLGPHEIYASLFARGTVSRYSSGRTRPLAPATSDATALRALSRERYGRPLDEIEAGFTELYDIGPDQDLGPTGRRRRPS